MAPLNTAAPGTLGHLADCVRDIMIMMTYEGQLLAVNMAAITAYGYDRSTLLCMNIRQLRADETKSDVAKQMAQAVQGGILFETVHRRADGSHFPVEVSSTAAVLSGQRIVVSVIRDISDRRRTELLLMQTADRLQMTLDAGGMGRWELDLATGARVRDARVLTLCGLPADTPDDRGTAFDDLIHPDDRPQRDAALREALQGRGEYRCEFRIRRADTGEERWLAARGRITADESGKPIRLVGVNFDVSERRRAEAAAREQGERLRVGLEAGRMAVWERDMRADTIRSSPELNRLLGFPADAVPTTEEIRSHYWPGERERLRKIAEDTVHRHDRFAEVEFRFCRPDGEVRWLIIRAEVQRDSAGMPTRMLGVVFDVTERRGAEQALREGEERMRLALAAAKMSTWSYDVGSGIATRSGNLVGEQPGLSRERFTLADWLSYVHPDDGEHLQRAIEDAIAGLQNGIAVEYRMRKPGESGTAWIWIATHGAVVERDPTTGLVTRLAGIGLDVTERKEAEQRQSLLMREVDHRAKNALAVVQSVLRITPKNDVNAYAASVEGRVRALARAHSLLAEQRWSGADMRVIIEAELAPFLSPPVPGDSIAPPRVQLDGPSLRVGAEAAQALSMTFHELATNAIKHGALSVPGGVVRLSWKVHPKADSLQLDWVEEGGPPITTLPSRRGFGTRVISMTVESLLCGSVDKVWGRTGFSCRFWIGLARLTRDISGGVLDRVASG